MAKLSALSTLRWNKLLTRKTAILVTGLLAITIGVAFFFKGRCSSHLAYSPGGMWLPEQMSQHADTLKALGLDFPVSGITSPEHEPLSASVFLGGCSASFISPHGLIATNHHCVVGILNYLGKDGTDYQKEGFVAKDQSQEKPAAPTQKVFITLAYEDVTETIREGLELIPEPIVRTETVERRIDELIRTRELSEKAKDPAIKVEVKGFFRDSKFYLILKKQIRDIRLVYAPHEGIGNFGGDIDNWHWPRHTGDFSLLRAYVSKDGASAPYSPQNVPYSSVHYLKMPTEPLKKGDLVFVMGYPGATERWETESEVKKEIEEQYPHQIDRSRGLISVLEKFETSSNPQSARVAKGLLPRLRNYLPLWEGELAGMKSFHIQRDKQKEQESLARWIEEKPERRERFASILKTEEENEIQSSGQPQSTSLPAKDLDKIKDRALREFIHWGFQSRAPAHLLRAALLIVRMAEERIKKDEDRRPEFKQRDWENLSTALGQVYQDQIDVDVEKSVLAYFLEEARKVGNDSLLEAVTNQKQPDEKNISDRLAAIYQGTQLLNLKTRMDLFDHATPTQLSQSKDSAIQVALKILELWKKADERADEERGKDLIEMALWAEARLQQQNISQAPDANASLRISFGTVRNYCHGFFNTAYPTFTYASEAVAKDTGKKPFNAPNRLLERVKKREFGTYAAKETGDVPIAFLSDLDITGGNSGSPVLNRKGELAGLAFDGVVEAMVSDKKFLPALSRTIAVDTRYFLWVLDAVESADWILEELGQTPQFSEQL